MGLGQSVPRQKGVLSGSLLLAKRGIYQEIFPKTIKTMSRPPPRRPTGMKPFGYVYDERMLEHVCNYDKTVAEKPERMKVIYERLKAEGLLENALKIEAREAEVDELLLNHPLEIIKEMSALDTDEACEDFCRSHEILWMNPQSESAARIAAGSSIDMVKAHKEGRIGNGFAMIRPPGHHSYGKNPMGYCVYNNVALAAKYAVNHLGYERVSIVDFDYHAANGTYYSVRDDPRIHLTSFHSYHRGLFWPFSKDFDYATPNHTIFIPLNCTMNTESDYIGAFNHVVLPVLKEWKPQLILISAGFDAGYYDLMLDVGQAIKAPGFGHMARSLTEVCPDGVLALLEGGYFPHQYAESAVMMTRGLQGMDLPKVHLTDRINGSMTEVIWNNIIHHSERWKCLEAHLEKLQKQQKSLGLAEFVPSTQIFLGKEIKDMWNRVISMKACRTRDWFPELSPELKKLCIDKIDEVKTTYNYSPELTSVTEEQLLKQLIWDLKMNTECHTKAALGLQVFSEDFLSFMEHRKDHMMVCDWELIRKMEAEN